jgi:hypothetical protein
MSTRDSKNDLIDVCAAALRVVEHSSFYRNINNLLRAENCSSLSGVLELISL